MSHQESPVSPDYLLREQVTGKCFVRMTGIGPMLGSEQEAMRFGSKEAAWRHPVTAFALTVLVPEPVSPALKGETR